MPANRIRADYDELMKLAGKWNQEAQSCATMLQSLRQVMETLQGGDWVGPGASAFYAEMNGIIIPALRRLIAALEQAAQCCRQLAELFKRAEDEAAAQLKKQQGGGGGGGGGAPPPAGAPSGGDSDTETGETGGGGGGGADNTGSGGGGAARGGAGAPEAAAVGGDSNPLTNRNPSELFKDDYMKGLIGSKYEGADSSKLNNAMETLATNPTGAKLESTLRDIADARGKPYESIRADYDKFQQVRQQAIDTAKAKGIDPPEQLNFAHPNFAGSTSQLRFGQVVGDAFGIDPVFGAMLSPTGGLVGPGNAAFDAGESPVGYHGVVHDAAGYLKNFHDTGPGYDYLGREGRDTTSPLSGQREGIAYWRDTMGGTNPGSAFSEYLMRGVVGGVDLGSRALDTLKSVF